jgi:DNA polymerase-3 subunit gamma/tau
MAAMPATFEAVVQLIRQHGPMPLAGELYNYVHPVQIEPGKLEIRLTDEADSRVPSDLALRLSELTGRRWLVSVSRQPGQPTLAQRDQESQSARRAQAAAHPLVQAVLNAFPGAELVAVRDGVQAPGAAAANEADGDGPAYMSDNDIDPLDELD